MSAQFTIEGRNKGQADIQKNFLWQLWIPTLPPFADPTLLGQTMTFDEIVMACKSAIIPGRTLDTYESYFYGQKQIFPINQSYGNKFTVSLEEREDQKVFKTMTAWMQSICNSDPSNPFATFRDPTIITKKQYVVDVWLKLYKYNGDSMSKAIRFRNAFPSNMSEVSLEYSGNEAVKFSIEFSYDYFQVI